MPEDLAAILSQSPNDPVALVAASHVLSHIDGLNKLYDNEVTRDIALSAARDFLAKGNGLHKAATAAWMKERGIATSDDKPDPNASAPAPNKLSDGMDAPDSGAAAAGAKPEHCETKPEHDHHAHKPASKKDVVAKLRAMAAQRLPAKPAPSTSAAAAYEAGVRDATAKHAHTAHRIGVMASKHAFRLGAEAGHRMAGRQAAAAQPGMGADMPGVVSKPVVMQPAMGKLAKYFRAKAGA